MVLEVRLKSTELHSTRSTDVRELTGMEMDLMRLTLALLTKPLLCLSLETGPTIGPVEDEASNRTRS